MVDYLNEESMDDMSQPFCWGRTCKASKARKEADRRNKPTPQQRRMQRATRQRLRKQQRKRKW